VTVFHRFSTSVDIDAALIRARQTARMTDAGAPRRPARVIFVCTHNSARSQMAEGMLRAWGGDGYEVASAGTERTRVRPEAIAVMRELGIDIGSHESKTLDPFLGQPFDWLITVCDQAREACPTLPGVANQLHWSIDDPSAADGDEAERLAAFRTARDDLAARIRAFLEER
jgi:arsenate reductase